MARWRLSFRPRTSAATRVRTATNTAAGVSMAAAFLAPFRTHCETALVLSFWGSSPPAAAPHRASSPSRFPGRLEWHWPSTPLRNRV